MTWPGEDGIGEEDLHAYVDGFLDAERRAAVARYLEQHPDVARRVAAYSAQREALRAAFAVAAEPTPPHLNLSRLIIEARLARRRSSWRIAAAIALALGVGGAGGWVLHGAQDPRPGTNAYALAVLKRQALSSYAVYAPDQRRPIELDADRRDDLARWLSDRLNRTVSPPDLSALGYRLLGGRLLATEQGGAAALLMYEDAQGTRLAILMRPMRAEYHAPLSAMGNCPVSGDAWIAKGLGYALVARVPPGELRPLAEQVQRQLDQST
jgi:anti-sigma factor RsiW